MRFLVVDNGFQACLLICKILKPYGFIKAIANYKKCIKKLYSSLKNNRPFDLITLDIIKPCLNGHKALKKTREAERKESVKLCDKVHSLMTSGLKNSKKLTDAYFLGAATFYIEKPIDKAALLNRISMFGIKLKMPKTS